MKLFKYEGYKVVVDPEALKLAPFKAIWNRDKSKTKDKASDELAFVYFFADPRSDYQYITDDNERIETISIDMGLGKDWKPDATIMKAVEFYKKFKTASVLLFEDLRFMADKLRTQMKEIDLTDSEDPIKALKDMTSALTGIPKLIKDLNETEKAMNRDFEEAGKIRGSSEKTIFDDDIEL